MIDVPRELLKDKPKVLLKNANNLQKAIDETVYLLATTPTVPIIVAEVVAANAGFTAKNYRPNTIGIILILRSISKKFGVG